MTVFTPYSGSLLRLAVTTVAVVALFAAAFAYWEHSAGHARNADLPRGLPGMLR